MAVQKPKLLFAAKVDRRRYFRRFMWMILGGVAALGATLALDMAIVRTNVNRDVASVGEIVGIIVVVLLALRALLNLRRWLFTRSEAFKIFDQGFVWKRKGKQYKYSWIQVLAYREGVHSVYLFGRPLFPPPLLPIA